jgi:hypothetical protein
MRGWGRKRNLAFLEKIGSQVNAGYFLASHCISLIQEYVNES